MELIINNIGKLHKETRILFDGITILAGENGSGKSTISKALFCMFHALYDIDAKIRRDREREIANIILNAKIAKEGSGRRLEIGVSGRYVDQLIDAYAENNSIRSIEECILKSDLRLAVGETAEALAQKIEQVLLLPDDMILERMVSRVLQNRFDGHIANVNYPTEDCSIRLILKGEELSVRISPDGTLSIQQGIRLLKDVTYIDDSYGSEYLFGGAGWYYSSGHYSIGGLRSDSDIEKDGDLTAVGELLSEKKAADILALMNDAGIGEMRQDENGQWVYKAQNLRSPIGIENLSSGTKTFLAIKFLLSNGLIEKNGVLILDEPEVHLHPKWQDRYAEIIVLLQKTYDLTLLINTHSVDFISFLEYYSKKYERKNYCHYYLMNNAPGGTYATAEDVTASVDKIYQELGLPYIRVIERLDEEADS